MKRHFLSLSFALAGLGGLMLTGCSGGSAPASSVKLSGKLAFTLAEEASADPNFDIYTQNADGTGRMRLTTDPAFDTDPALSPDGSKIAFTSDREGTGLNVYTMNADGTGVKRLTDSAINALRVVGGSEPAWSPDGSQLVYSAVNDGAGSSICVMNADGTNLRRLNESRGFDSAQPCFSPDGSKIAFSSSVGMGTQIFVMNSDGTNVQQLTSSGSATENARNRDPKFSPGGAQILYTTVQDRVLDEAGDLMFEIYRMNADGSGQARLTNNTDEDIDPVWSPDGTKILFTSTRGTSGGIFVMNADGTEQTKVSDTFGLDLSWR